MLKNLNWFMIGAVLVWFGSWSVVGYVAYHFILKVW